MDKEKKEVSLMKLQEVVNSTQSKVLSYSFHLPRDDCMHSDNMLELMKICLYRISIVIVSCKKIIIP